MADYSRNPRYWLERRTKRRSGYPAATLAYYGPDNKRASKIVVGIVPSERERSPSELKKWHSETTDLRTDPDIALEILAFLDERRVERVTTVERIIGCPHEEGIDYPEGECCPQCPFWSNVDRFTGARLR